MRNLVKKLIIFPIFLLTIFACNSEKNGEIKKETNVSSNNIDKDIVVFSTNDVLSSYDTYLGYAGLKKFIDEFDKENNYIALVDAGNFSTGNDIAEKSFGKSSIEIINEIGYDIVVPGVEEFKYGFDTFLENMNLLGDKVISCNLINLKTNSLFFKPYKIMNFGNKKVAFVGVTTPETFLRYEEDFFFNENGEQLISFLEDNDGTALYTQIQYCVDSAIKEGANKVIMICNLGSKTEYNFWSSISVISNTTNIDGVIDGYSKEVVENGLMINKTGGFVPIVQAGSNLQYVGAMNILKDNYLFPAVISEITIKEKDPNLTNFINDIKLKYD